MEPVYQTIAEDKPHAIWRDGREPLRLDRGMDRRLEYFAMIGDLVAPAREDQHTHSYWPLVYSSVSYARPEAIAMARGDTGRTCRTILTMLVIVNSEPLAQMVFLWYMTYA